MRAVVTGGAGFLGSHLCDRLIGRGDSVICIDDFSTGSKENVAHLIGQQRFRLVDADVSTGRASGILMPRPGRWPAEDFGLLPQLP